MSNIAYWGISKEVCQKYFGTSVKYSSQEVVKCGYVSLRNLVSDCGAVTISNISCAEGDDIKNALEFCRLSGYSLIVGTVTDEETAEALEKLGFEVKRLGCSHRNPSKPHYLVHYHIPEDKFKVFGYNKTEE